MSDDSLKKNHSVPENQDDEYSPPGVNSSNKQDLANKNDNELVSNPPSFDANIENNELYFSQLSFKKAFWLILTGIAILQIFQFSLVFHFGFDVEKYPSKYYLWDEVGGVIWYITFLIVVIYDLRKYNIRPKRIFNFNVLIVKERIPQISKYLSGCAVFVIALSFLSSGTELQLEHQTPVTISLVFMTTVLIAPVCEELVFRGYLYTAMFSSFKRKKERMVVNAMLFACAHVFLIEFLLGAVIPYYIFVLGYLLAKLYEESRSVIPGILLHSLNNALVFGIDLIKIN